MVEQLPSETCDITRRSRELRAEFDSWLVSRNYSPLSVTEKATLDAFACWLLNGHTLKAKPHE